MESVMEFSSTISPDDTRMVNPVMVDRQLQEMRTVMRRMRQAQYSEEQSMSHLYELANRINGASSKNIFAKRRVAGLRVLSKRRHAIHETSDPIITRKLVEIRRES